MSTLDSIGFVFRILKNHNLSTSATLTVKKVYISRILYINKKVKPLPDFIHYPKMTQFGNWGRNQFNYVQGSKNRQSCRGSDKLDNNNRETQYHNNRVLALDFG